MLAAAVLIAALLGLRLFVAPATDVVSGANTVDAVAVFGGNDDGQLEAALELMNRQAANTLVLPGGADPNWPEANRLCAGGAPFAVVCPEGGSERAIAQAVGQLSTERSWANVAVVAPRAMLSRVTLLTKRCTSASVRRVAVASSEGTATRVLGAFGAAFRYSGALLGDRGC